MPANRMNHKLDAKNSFNFNSNIIPPKSVFMQGRENADRMIKKIIIVGGGSSGWMAASYLSKALNFKIDITLIESDKIGRIGVGEATIISIKEILFDYLGISEAEWMPECDGTFKLGIKYENWNRPRTEGSDHFYHVSGEIPLVEGIPLSHLWIKKRLEGFEKSMTYSCYPTADLCDNFKSPKFLSGQRAVHYAYHFDALKLADFLKKWSIDRGVTAVYDEISRVEQDEEGNISQLTGSSGNTYSGDLYLDCSGFEALLIDKVLNEPFISFADSLLTDRAISINIPSNPVVNGIRPFTTATALNHGWAWQIPLYSRSGNGYVYSSKFVSDDQAENEVREFLGAKPGEIDCRLIKFRSGRRKNSWVKNCIAIGIANGFLEPLESTGIYFAYAALYQLMQYFPDKNFNESLRVKFNERISWMIDDVRNFIILHFCTSPRTDTPFWQANKYDLKIPESVQSELALQKAGVPIRRAYRGTESWVTATYHAEKMPIEKAENNEILNYTLFDAEYDRFWTNSNYQMIFSGVNFLPENIMPVLAYRDDIVRQGEVLFEEIKQRTERLLAQLPSQYEYLKHQKFNYQPLLENSY